MGGFKDVEEIYPVQLAEYAHLRKIFEKPTFALVDPSGFKEKKQNYLKIKCEY